jgi:long-subunit acyl-CoA synthetase (AMP-forming)
MPKGCMLSHDNLTWLNIPLEANMKEYNQTLEKHNHRVLSFLPLSHVAAFFCDVVSQIHRGS